MSAMYDSSDREQSSVCIRWVDSEMEPHEDFIGLYVMDRVCVSDILKAFLTMHKISLSKCHG